VPTTATTTPSSKTTTLPNDYKSSWASLPGAVRAAGEGDAKSKLTRLRSQFGYELAGYPGPRKPA
jgi:hypothetical protein